VIHLNLRFLCDADLVLYATGKTTSSASDDDLSIDVLVQDFLSVLMKVFPDPAATPSLLVCGLHSQPLGLTILLSAHWA
jgi:hypothetical protein